MPGGAIISTPIGVAANSISILCRPIGLHGVFTERLCAVEGSEDDADSVTPSVIFAWWISTSRIRFLPFLQHGNDFFNRWLRTILTAESVKSGG